MDAVVYPSGSGLFSVSLRVGGVEQDVAGPFDDKMDAVDCARRSVYGDGTVQLMGSMQEAFDAQSFDVNDGLEAA